MSNNKRIVFCLFLIFCCTLWYIGLRTSHAASLQQTATEGETIFKTKCVGCHTIGGGDLAGPDLKGVTQKREINWLNNWLKAPDKMLANGDPIATQLLQAFNNIPMPNLMLSDAEVAALIAYLQSIDSGNISAPVAPAVPSKLDGDPDNGRKLFTGEVPLYRGGIACIACHSTIGSAALGGGSLGPDLTHVYTRFGHNGLAASLESLPFPTMQNIFASRQLTAKEQNDLLAFFAQVNSQTESEPNPNDALFSILGIGTAATLALFGVMLPAWQHQRMGISQRLRKYNKL